jgi:hypothetical protein
MVGREEFVALKVIQLSLESLLKQGRHVFASLFRFFQQ